MREGQGIFYYNNGDIEIGNYFQDQRIGIHINCSFKNGIIQTCFFQ